MKVIYNKILPVRGFKAINLFGVMFVRKEFKGTVNDVNERTIRHESIHTEQIRELLYLPFYIWYLLEWLLRLPFYGFSKSAYFNISFEREAYANEKDESYLGNRKCYAFFKYLNRH